MISIVVPVYKAEAYLHRCVGSILAQSYEHWELILVDDGSPDRSGAICDEYAGKDSRVQVIHQKNRGVSAARNAGIDWAFANSDSQWLTFVDSDDWIHRDYLRILKAAADRYGTDMAMCGLFWTDRTCEDQALGEVEPILLSADQTFAQHYAICNAVYNKLFRKHLFQTLRFAEGQTFGEDAAITPHLIRGAGEVAIVPEKLYYYYSNPESVTHAKWSDQKLAGIAVHEERLRYFREHGYLEAYRRQKEGYVEELANKIQDLLDGGDASQAQQQTLRMLQGKLRKALKAAREDGMAPFSRENLWAYLFAMRTDILWKTARKAQKLYHQCRRRS